MQTSHDAEDVELKEVSVEIVASVEGVKLDKELEGVKMSVKARFLLMIQKRRREQFI